MSILDGVKIGNFRLHSGSKSPVLFDVMEMIKEPRDRDYVKTTLIDQVYEKIPQMGLNDLYIVGIEFGGAILAAMVADNFSQKLAFVRKDGTCTLKPGVYLEEAVIVDDVYTTGSSIAMARSALESIGFQQQNI